MQVVLQNHSQARIAIRHISLGKAMGWGMIGGLAATLIMDLILIGIFMAVGMLPFTCFSIVGDTVARLFLLQNMTLAGSVLLGAAAHYLIGPVLGALFGVAMRYIPALQVGSWKKLIVSAVLYVEILSQPMLALTPILLRMTASDALQWFGGSMGMHVIWGCVLGAVCSLGLRLPVAANSKKFNLD